jgi:hypothetical protein
MLGKSLKKRILRSSLLTQPRPKTDSERLSEWLVKRNKPFFFNKFEKVKNYETIKSKTKFSILENKAVSN